MSDTVKKNPGRKRPRYVGDGYHTSKKCRGCPYGYKTYCVGVCWKEVYAGYPKKRKQTEAE